jgi:hypothetical protein
MLKQWIYNNVGLSKKKKKKVKCSYSTHFNVGDDNPKEEKKVLQKQYAKQSCILLSLNRI